MKPVICKYSTLYNKLHIMMGQVLQPHNCGTLQWRHNKRDAVPNYWRFDCLLSRLFRRRSKQTPKLLVTGLCEGNPPVDSPHKGPVTRNMKLYVWYTSIFFSGTYSLWQYMGKSSLVGVLWYTVALPVISMASGKIVHGFQVRNKYSYRADSGCAPSQWQTVLLYYDVSHRLGASLGLILGLRTANNRRRYFVTTSLNGWVQA